MKEETNAVLWISLVISIVILALVVAPLFIFNKEHVSIHGSIVSMSKDHHSSDDVYLVYFSDGSSYKISSYDVGDFDGYTGVMDITLSRFTNINMGYWFVDSVVKLDGWTN